MTRGTPIMFALALALGLALGGLAGCLGTGTSNGSSFFPSGDEEPRDSTTMTNNPGQLLYTGAMWHQTKQRTVTWENDAPAATVQWSGTATQGSLHIVISDAAGFEVHRQAISAGSSEYSEQPTGFGVPGPWTVEFTFEEFSGTLYLQLTSRMPV